MKNRLENMVSLCQETAGNFHSFLLYFFGTGAHCERCADGYYGDPRNGGKCAG